MEQFNVLLDRYAELAVRIGVNLQKGQTLYIAAPIVAADYVRCVVKKAYDAGAADVMVDWSDETVTRTRFDLAADAAFETYPEWNVQKMEALVQKGAAFMTVYSENPDLLKGVNPKRVATWQKTMNQASQNYRAAISNGFVSRTVVSTPTPEWAMKVFPGLDADMAVEKLWEEIFKVTRVVEDDPVASWKAHRASLTEKLDFLNRKQFKALYYRSVGAGASTSGSAGAGASCGTGAGSAGMPICGRTNLTIELPENHVWIGGGLENAKGVYCHPNIPTEEVFTAPKKDGVNGTVSSTKPLNYGGTLIDNFTLTFEAGRIVEVTAEHGEETLKNLIETDEGAHYLGEVALVPDQSPISQTGLVFYNTLFDENASCHLAIGNAYAFNIEGGTSMTKDELEQHHINTSMTHVDFMIGSESLDIDGEAANGELIPLFRGGNWVI